MGGPDPPHIVPCEKFHRIGGAPPETFSSEKYDAPEEVGGDRYSFDSPIRKCIMLVCENLVEKYDFSGLLNCKTAEF